MLGSIDDDDDDLEADVGGPTNVDEWLSVTDDDADDDGPLLLPLDEAASKSQDLLSIPDYAYSMYRMHASEF